MNFEFPAGITARVVTGDSLACHAPGCENYRKSKSFDYCEKHRLRLKRMGTLEHENPVCPDCGDEFITHTRRQVYCSKACATSARNKRIRSDREA